MGRENFPFMENPRENKGNFHGCVENMRKKNTSFVPRVHAHTTRVVGAIITFNR